MREKVELLHEKTLHEGWVRYIRATFRIGGKTIEREIVAHGGAVAVLPYDPERRVALLVRQFRAPVFVATGKGELLECIAGILEEDEEGAARREALEEAGLRLGQLEPVVCGWSSPGLATERIYLFLAIYGAADRDGDGGGKPEEGENITVQEYPLDELSNMADAGTLTDLKTFALVQSLRLRRPELFRP
jgi:nudix-type nucleoside diphosphatase (YffH/AdpP family)